MPGKATKYMFIVNKHIITPVSSVFPRAVSSR